MDEKVHDVMLCDRRVKVEEIAMTVGMSSEHIHHIFHVELDMSKLFARWVPRLLNVDQENNRALISNDNLKLFSIKPLNFLHRFVTIDKAWLHYYVPPAERQSQQ